MQATVVTPVVDHGRRAHDGADLELNVGNEWLGVVGAALGDDPRRVALVSLLDDELTERAALGVVGVEQRRPCLAAITAASFHARLCAS